MNENNKYPDVPEAEDSIQTVRQDPGLLWADSWLQVLDILSSKLVASGKFTHLETALPRALLRGFCPWSGQKHTHHGHFCGVFARGASGN